MASINHQWSKADDKRLRTLAAKHSGPQIADILTVEFGRNISRNSIISRARKIDVCLGKAKHKNAWDAQRDDRLRELVGAHPGAKIAEILSKEFGVHLSKNAVIARCHRLDLRPTADQIKSFASEGQLKGRQPAAATLRRQRREAREAAGLPPIKRVVKPSKPSKALTLVVDNEIVQLAPEPVGDKAVHFDNARACHCRFPLWSGDDKTGLVCGEQTVAGSSFCDHHHGRVYNPVPQRKEAPRPHIWFQSNGFARSA